MNRGHANKGLSNKTPDQLVTTPIPPNRIYIFQILHYYFSIIGKVFFPKYFVLFTEMIMSPAIKQMRPSPSVEIQPEGGASLPSEERPGVQSEAL